MEVVCCFLTLSDFRHQQLAPFVGKHERKAMAPSKKVVSVVESSEDHSMQEQMAKMIEMMDASTHQVTTANRALKEMKET